jgi:hypothetical protein
LLKQKTFKIRKNVSAVGTKGENAFGFFSILRTFRVKGIAEAIAKEI